MFYIKNMEKKKISSLLYILSAGVLLVVAFVYHRKTPFMMDDLWYSTNLVTGQPLSGLKDIIESQIWHYLNWGGRSMTHSLLQFILMGGEVFADILNICVHVLLAFVMTLFIKKEDKVFSFANAVVFIVALNPGLFYSIFWQSGSVNYLYSTVWILFFVYTYIREFSDGVKPLMGASVWMVPLGLITGWSNENMGPASFCLAVGVSVYLLVKRKRRIKAWMIEGIAFSFIGSALCILAPGNFVRSEFSESGSVIEAVRNRFISMLTAGCAYLFLSVIILIFLIVISFGYCKVKLDECEISLLVMSVLAFGAMLLSPHFPDRAAFGIMILNTVVSLRLINKITAIYKDFSAYTALLFSFAWVYSLVIIVTRIV